VVCIGKSWSVQEEKDQEINPESSSVVNDNESEQKNPVGSEQFN